MGYSEGWLTYYLISVSKVVVTKLMDFTSSHIMYCLQNAMSPQ